MTVNTSSANVMRLIEEHADTEVAGVLKALLFERDGIACHLQHKQEIENAKQATKADQATESLHTRGGEDHSGS
jgi:hypothetical protein